MPRCDSRCPNEPTPQGMPLENRVTTVTVSSGRELTQRADEHVTPFMDRATKAYMDERRPMIEALAERMVNADAMGWRMQHAGVSRHAGVRDYSLPRDLYEWVVKGCPET